MKPAPRYVRHRCPFCGKNRNRYQTHNPGCPVVHRPRANKTRRA